MCSQAGASMPILGAHFKIPMCMEAATWGGGSVWPTARTRVRDGDLLAFPASSVTQQLAHLGWVMVYLETPSGTELDTEPAVRFYTDLEAEAGPCTNACACASKIYNIDFM